MLGIIARTLANPAVTEWGRKRFAIWALVSLGIAVVKLTSICGAWFLVVPMLSRKSGWFKSEISNHVQWHKVSSSPVLTWQLLQHKCVSFSCEVCSTPLTLHVQHLGWALTLRGGEIKMLSLGISLHWSFLSLLLVWRSSARSTAPPLCVGSGHRATRNGAVQGRWLWVEHG